MLKEQLDVDATLQSGSNGIFEITVDGALVSAKTIVGFPTEQQIVDAVAKAIDVDEK